jgi:uncharacterized repeat protein (TIGR01451 family)
VQTTSVPPNSVSGDTLIWNFSNLSNSASLSLGNIGVLTSLSAQIGDSICVTMIVEPIAGDMNAANNTTTVCRPVSNAYDPNDKDVAPHGDVAAGTWLTYTIRFQNTGNDTAYNIFILDTIDADLDMNTFQPIVASHTFSTYIQDGNVVKFDFPNIMLVDSNMNEPLSHGWVSYRIKSLTGLNTGTMLDNTAYIYFDFNPAVVTNTVTTTIDNTVSADAINYSRIYALVVYPSPAGDQLIISNNNTLTESIEIFDVFGKRVYVVQTPLPDKKPQAINVSKFTAGVYFVRVKTSEGVKSARFVKE